MASGRILIGQFLNQRRQNPDTDKSQYGNEGSVNKGKSFLDLDPDDLPPVNKGPSKVAFEPAPALRTPTPAWGPIKVADFIKMKEAGFQQGPPTPLSRPAADPYLGPIPAALAAAGPQPSLPTNPSVPPADAYVIPNPQAMHEAARQPSLPTANSRSPAPPQVLFEPGERFDARFGGAPPAASTPAGLKLPLGIKYSGRKPSDVTPPPDPARRAFGTNPDYQKGPVAPAPELPGVIPSSPTAPPGPFIPTYTDSDGQRRQIGGQVSSPIEDQKTAKGWSMKTHSDRITANPNVVQDPRNQESFDKFTDLHPHASEDASVTAHFTAQLKNVDTKMKNFMNNSGLGGSSFDLDKVGVPGTIFARPASGPGTQMLNPKLYAEHIVRLGRAFGSVGGDNTTIDARALATKLALFAADQVALHLLNRHGRFWNPVTIAPPPVAGAFLANTLDITTGTPPGLTGYIDSRPQGLIDSKPGFYEGNHGNVTDPLGVGRDIHKSIAKGNYNELQVSIVPPFVNIIKNGGATGPLNILNRLTPSLFGAPSEDTALLEDPADPTILPLMPLVDVALHTRNAIAPKKMDSVPASEPLFTIDQIADDMLERGDSKFMKRDVVSGKKVFNIESVFEKHLVKLGGEEWFPKGKLPYNPAATTITFQDRRKMEKSFYGSGIVPAAFSSEDLRDGFVVTEQEKDSKVDDDDAYVPLSFTDLRPISEKKFKTVYFRPFITNLTEDLSPSWNKKNYFGRVDPVMGYQSTERTIALSFIVATFAPEDLKVIYKKLNLLSSMVYPEYDKDMLFKSGPVCRLRVGDLITTAKNSAGLPGVIESLSFDYNEHVWELKKDNKVPMGYRVSLTFTVLHDVPIGVGADGKFGGLGTISEGKYQLPKSVNDSSALGPDVEGTDMFRKFGDVGRKEINGADGGSGGGNIA